MGGKKLDEMYGKVRMVVMMVETRKYKSCFVISKGVGVCESRHHHHKQAYERLV